MNRKALMLSIGLGFACIATAWASPAIVDRSLVGWWRFNEETFKADSSGYGQTISGAFNGMSGVASGSYDGSGYMNVTTGGGSTTASLPDGVTLDTTTRYTFAARFKGACSVSYSGSGGTKKVMEMLKGTDGKWHFTAMRYQKNSGVNSTYAKMLICDPVDTSFWSDTSRPEMSQDDLLFPVSVDGGTVTIGGKLGRGSNTVSYKGLLDDVMVFNRMLSKWELTRLYLTGETYVFPYESTPQFSSGNGWSSKEWYSNDKCVLPAPGDMIGAAYLVDAGQTLTCPSGTPVFGGDVSKKLSLTLGRTKDAVSVLDGATVAAKSTGALDFGSATAVTVYDLRLDNGEIKVNAGSKTLATTYLDVGATKAEPFAVTVPTSCKVMCANAVTGDGYIGKKGVGSLDLSDLRLGDGGLGLAIGAGSVVLPSAGNVRLSSAAAGTTVLTDTARLAAGEICTVENDAVLAFPLAIKVLPTGMGTLSDGLHAVIAIPKTVKAALTPADVLLDISDCPDLGKITVRITEDAERGSWVYNLYVGVCKLYGTGTTTVLDSSEGRDELPVQILAGDGVTAKSNWQFKYNQKIRCGLEIDALNELLIFNSLTVCGYGSLAADYFLNGSKATIAAGSTIGTADGDADFRLKNATFIVNGSYNFYLGYMTAPGRANMRVTMSLEDSTFQSGGALTLMQGVDGSNTENCLVTLSGDSKLSTTYITHQGGDRSRIRFAGGRYVATGSSNPLFHVYGYSYSNNWPSPWMTVEGANGNAIDVEIAADRNLCGGTSNRRINLTGNGGFVKRGAGILTWNRVGCDYPWDKNIVSVSTYTGDTVVRGGGIKQGSSDYQPGRGNLVLESAGTTFDLNGIGNALFTGVTGLGSVINSSATSATLSLGYNNASGDWNAAVAASVPVEKIGTGTLTIGVNAASYSGNFTVSAGTAKLTDGVSAISFGTVTIAEGATLDVRGAAFKCVKLVNNGTLLDDSSEVKVIGGDAAVDYNDLRTRGVVEKQGTGTATVYGGLDAVSGVRVTAGTLAYYVPTTFSGKYFKLVFRSGVSGVGTIAVSELSLFDAGGNRVNQGDYAYTPLAGSGGSRGYVANLTGISAGETALVGSDWYMHNDGEDPAKLFDGNTGTSCILRYGWGNAAVGFRIPDAAAPVVSYQLTTCGNAAYNNYNLNRWQLWGSMDGKSWVLLDDRGGAPQSVPGTAATVYNGGSPYLLAWNTLSEDVVFGENGVVEIAAGAALRLSNPQMQIARFEIDCAAGAGNVNWFSPAVGGVLNVVNLPPSAHGARYVLPLTVGELYCRDNFESWSVTVEGQPSAYRLRFRGGRLTITDSEPVVYVK